MSKAILKYFLIIGSLLISSNFIFASSLTKEQKMLDFQYLVAHVKSSYGPLEYKTKKGIVDVDKLVKQFTKKIKTTKTNGDYYYMIREFVSSFQDSHFVANIPTTYRAMLPFRVEWVKGKYLIHSPQPIIGNIQLNPGDELLKINNKPVNKIVKNLYKYINSGTKNTQRRWGAWLLSIRPGAMVPVPSGKVVISVKLKGTQNIVNIDTKWQITGEFFDEKEEYFLKKAAFQSVSKSTLSFNPIDDLSIDKQLSPLGKAFSSITYMCNPVTRVAIPEDATIIMQRPFTAYYYPTKKGNVGYLRMPHYSFGKAGSSVLANYAYAIYMLEKHTKVLVIDQDHNCGGSVHFLGNVVGLFMDKPVENALFKLVANKSMYMSLKQSIQNENPNVLGFAIWKNFLTKLKKAWLSGKYLTPKISLQKIYPNAEARYTKPIIVLADELSGSGGDAFPALMQGYKRATILGTTTSGAGGSVSSIPSLPFSQIKVNLTRSLFFHPNGRAIENNGVKPNIFYRITESDFLNKYIDYREFYTKKALELL